MMARLLIGALLALSALVSHAQVIKGRVSAVKDGDTLVIQVGRDLYSIRLADIDAPETCHSKGCARLGQPGGEAARQALFALAMGQEAVANCRGASYDRSVCYVTVAGMDMSTQMAALGWAWFEPRYGRSRQISQAAKQAQDHRTGIWALSGNVAPWVWRHDCWESQRCPGGVR